MTKNSFAFSVLFVSVLIVLPLAAGGLLLRRLVTLGQELAWVRTEISVSESKQRNVKSLKNVLQEVSGRQERINDLFIDEKSLVRFIEDLEALAKESGVELKVDSAVLPQSPEEAGPTFEFTASGEFRNLFKYQRTLETSPYQLIFEKIETAKVSREGVKKGPGWSARYKLKVISYLL